MTNFYLVYSDGDYEPDYGIVKFAAENLESALWHKQEVEAEQVIKQRKLFYSAFGLGE